MFSLELPLHYFHFSYNLCPLLLLLLNIEVSMILFFMLSFHLPTVLYRTHNALDTFYSIFLPMGIFISNSKTAQDKGPMEYIRDTHEKHPHSNAKLMTSDRNIYFISIHLCTRQKHIFIFSCLLLVMMGVRSCWSTNQLTAKKKKKKKKKKNAPSGN